MSLENFIRLADGMVEFEDQVNAKRIPLTSSYVVAIHQKELKAKWADTKAAYESLRYDHWEQWSCHQESAPIM